MRSDVDDRPCFKHYDLIRVTHSGKAMRDHHHGTPLHEVA